MYDIIIDGATLVDGTGTPARQADVGIAQGCIAALGDLAAGNAGERIEAGGRVVCPGFIHTHTHSDLTPLLDARCASKVRQGVTTELVGHWFLSLSLGQGDSPGTGRAGPYCHGCDRRWPLCRSGLI